MKFVIDPDSQLFETDFATFYDQVIFPSDSARETGGPLFARTQHSHEWYQLSLSGVGAELVFYDDPYGQSGLPQGRMDPLGGTLVVSRSAQLGGDWAIYRTIRGLPANIDAYPLPLDISTVDFMGWSPDGTRRLVVMRPRFYPQNTELRRLYEGESWGGSA